MNPETDSEDELPPGWEERATLEGSVYFVNHLEKSTQWSHPRTGKKKQVSCSLPFGWERRRLADGKILYVNHQEEKTTYIDPRLAFAKEIHDSSSLNTFRQRFDASSTAIQVLHGQDLSGTTAIVTGASPGGIGYEMARTLARCGCHVVLACRDLTMAEKAIGQIRSERAHAKCSPMMLDLSSLASVEMFAKNFKALHVKLDYLILNAGIFGHDHCLTLDNLELTFQVNFLSHFLLCHLLKSCLEATTNGKIVTISAESHRFSSLKVPSDLRLEDKLNKLWPTHFNSTLAYNDSKLFMLMMALEISQRWSRVKAISVHPGNMVSSRLPRHWWFYRLAFAIARPFAKSLQQAAAPGIFAVAAPEMKHVGGIYVNNCFPCQPSEIALDSQARHNLWITSLKLLQDRGYF